MKFIRFGGLSGTKYPKESFSGPYHSPPARKGIYAFIHPYTELFLVAWKLKWREGESEEEYKKRWNKFYKEQKRIFEYNGPIWTHFNLSITSINKNDSWNLIHTNDLSIALDNIKHEFKHELIKDSFRYEGQLRQIKDPFQRGLGGQMSIDCLEVFIEKKYLGKIR